MCGAKASRSSVVYRDGKYPDLRSDKHLGMCKFLSELFDFVFRQAFKFFRTERCAHKEKGSCNNVERLCAVLPENESVQWQSEEFSFLV